MDIKLFQKLSDKERVKAKELFINYKPVFDAITAILESEYKALDKEVTQEPKNIDQWAWQQAYLRGQQKAYQRLIKLLETSND